MLDEFVLSSRLRGFLGILLFAVTSAFITLPLSDGEKQNRTESLEGHPVLFDARLLQKQQSLKRIRFAVLQAFFI